MNITKIISAIGNNDSIFPLLIRDCGCENPIKCALTYNQNKGDKFIARQATREKAIDEYGASAIWLGGIPVISKICDKLIDKTGLNSSVSYKLFNDDGVQGLKTNIEKFKDIAPNAAEDLIKIQKNAAKYKNLQIAKFIATTAIPIALMGFILPKINFGITKKRVDFSKEKKQKTALKPQNINEFKKNSISFKGNFDILNITNIQKMMITDVGLGAGRVSTERSPEAKKEKFVAALGAFILNYITPKKFEKGLNSLSKKIFKVDSSLDPVILENKDFLNSIRQNALDLPKNFDDKSLIDYIDANPKSVLSTLAKNQNIVSFLDSEVRDPRKYVETSKLKELALNIQNFASSAVKSGNIEAYAKKALRAKSFNIISNILLSSFLLAYALPKAQFLYRSITQKDKLDPGVKAAMA